MNWYLHGMYEADTATTNGALFRLSGNMKTQNNEQWSKNTVIIHEVVVHDV
jgi:hypothetical protein